MSFNQSHGARRLGTLLAVLLAALIPSMSLAAEGNVRLSFGPQDTVYLAISFVLGVVALLTGIFLRGKVLAMSPGDDKMQEVGMAIHQGALAYLRQQVRTMAIFVVLIAILLTWMYGTQYNSMQIGMFTALCFIAGVAASYIAGYVGMDMAVRGNMRTAHAALTSYGKSLEAAFQSGAVAGMMTVGMGLIGATAIFFLGGADAMKYLVGFGFGGSLAALFMRVGGGIFTKAADVGADLVGKVEAGIPEDDPRNPATIADNVGDNVGDCAGMAADIFESYEVTLVAAIVLGAAASTIFDQPTWMKLILFALMARGVGIVASIIGVFSVKGSDNIDSDPLMSIRKGFYVSAVISIIGTGLVSYAMMGGSGVKIDAYALKSRGTAIFEAGSAIMDARDKIMAEKKIAKTDVAPKDVMEDPRVVALNLPKAQGEQIVTSILASDREDLEQTNKPMTGYKAVNLDDPELASLTVGKPGGANGMFDYTSLAEVWKAGPALDPITKKEVIDPDTKKPFLTGPRVYKVLQEAGPNAQPMPDGSKPEAKMLYLVHTDKQALLRELSQSETSGQFKFTWQDPKEGTPAKVFLSDHGSSKKLAIGVPVGNSDYLFNVANRITDSIYDAPKDKLNELQTKRQTLLDQNNQLQTQMQTIQAKATTEKDPAKKATLEAQSKALEAQLTAKSAEINKIASPSPINMQDAQANPQEVPWYTFFGCIFFGILMAFAIELLTDYYVSTHKKPVQEVAGVSTAGPAPMIIQGFAYGLESSVFSVVAIVVALIVPLIIFNPANYGGNYILSFYGVALVGLGLLTTTGYILAMDTFGPISDNAQGVFEMSGAGHTSAQGSKAVQRLDAAGNTTKALTKGFAIATAVVAAVALFHSFVEDAHLSGIGMRLEMPKIFLGLLLGGAAPYLFSAFSINAVGRASFELINEVRRQFRNDPGIMAGTSKPNYGACVAIVTAAAQKELLGPGILAIALPVLVGFGFGMNNPLEGAQALGGFLAGAILSGQLMAVLLANSGGMWDNAKKLIEDGLYGGKGTEAHKAGVVCDTVGDPFKDTAGPALNPLIKVMNLVALLLAPIVITDMPNTVRMGVSVLCVAALAFSIWWSKRGSMSTGLAAASAEQAAIASSGVSVPKPTSEKRITVDDEE